MKLQWVSLVVSLALVLPLADTAQAGPVEQVIQVAIHPSKPDVMVLRYRDGGSGLFYSSDAGDSWKLMCLSAMDPGIRNTGTIAVTNDGQTLMGVFEGLFHDDGHGCGWTRAPELGETWVSDIARHPSDPNIVFLTTSKGGEGQLNGMLQRGADGKLTDFGPKEELLISRLRIVENGDGIRIYQSVLKGTIKATVNGVEVDAPNYLIRYSDDNGETFEEFPFGGTDGSLRLQAADPSNPDRVIAVLDREGKDDDLLVSNDRGETFETYMTLSQFGALEFAEGGKVFIGEAGFSTLSSSKRALWVADNLESEPRMLAEYPVQCLTYQPETDTLFACQYREFGKVDMETGEFSRLFSFGDIEEFVDCGGQDIAMACEKQLCADYCTFGHFASAPMCSVYDTPTCGPCAAAIDRGEATTPECSLTGGAAGKGAAGMGAGGSTSEGSAGRMSGGAGLMSSGSSAGAPAAGAAGNSGNGDDEDEGGCSSTGRPNPSAFTASALMVFAALLAVRRRRRKLGAAS